MSVTSDVLDEAALRDEAVGLLQTLLRLDTSNPPGGETAAAQVLAEYLAPYGIECELLARDPSRANLIARLSGSGGGPSLALVGHTDVVPADPTGWRHDPFSGHLDDEGFLWGRGACDMKNEVVTRAVAMAHLARSGFVPGGDLLLLAVADEEVGTEGLGMSWLVEERPDIATTYALNEGAAERLQLADGRTVVTINIGEKGALGVRVEAIGEPSASTLVTEGVAAVPRLAELILRLDRHRPRRRIRTATSRLLRELNGSAHGDDMDAAIEQAVSLHPALEDLVAPLFAMTICPTMIGASESLNVAAPRAHVDCDCRTVPGTSIDEVLQEFQEALGGDLPYAVSALGPLFGGSSSGEDGELFGICVDWVELNDPGATVISTFCNGFTDSHYLREAFGTKAYGFWPVRSTPYDVVAEGVHALNERVHIDDLGYATRFHIEACQQLWA